MFVLSNQMREYELNKGKSVNALLYICKKLGGGWDKYSLLKILYFAEEKHLVTYGRPITGDQIIAMKYGPVPSWSFDCVKPRPENEKYFTIDSDTITANLEPDMDFLSKSELKCLDESINENSPLSFGELKKKSHNAAYEKTVHEQGLNAPIQFAEIAKSAGANDDLIAYISENISLKNWQ